MEIHVIFQGLASVGIITIETVGVRFYPYILTRVEIDVLGIAWDAVSLHPCRQVVVEDFGIGVENTVVHSLANPYLTVESLVKVIIEIKPQ